MFKDFKNDQRKVFHIHKTQWDDLYARSRSYAERSPSARLWSLFKTIKNIYDDDQVQEKDISAITRNIHDAIMFKTRFYDIEFIKEVINETIHLGLKPEASDPIPPRNLTVRAIPEELFQKFYCA